MHRCAARRAEDSSLLLACQTGTMADRLRMVDPQTSLGTGDFAAFLQSAGIGVTVTPGEAHWQNGLIESMVHVIKGCAQLAVAARNNHSRVKGFSPICSGHMALTSTRTLWKCSLRSTMPVNSDFPSVSGIARSTVKQQKESGERYRQMRQ